MSDGCYAGLEYVSGMSYQMVVEAMEAKEIDFTTIFGPARGANHFISSSIRVRGRGIEKVPKLGRGPKRSNGWTSYNFEAIYRRIPGVFDETSLEGTVTFAKVDGVGGFIVENVEVYEVLL